MRFMVSPCTWKVQFIYSFAVVINDNGTNNTPTRYCLACRRRRRRRRHSASLKVSM